MPTGGELTRTETDRLRECETAIERGLATFIEVGNALLTIRAGRLYRATHPTFEDYCRDRWSLSKTHANRLIDAAEVAEDLTPIGVKPANEAQARPLKQLPTEERADAWDEAVEESGGKPAAKHVKAAVDRRLGKVPHPAPGPSASEAAGRECEHCGEAIPAGDEQCPNCWRIPGEDGPTPESEPPAINGKSRVNGVLADDPPDVAAARAAGRIAAEAVPEISDPGTADDPGPAGDDAAGPANDDLPDGQWLASLPLSSILDGAALRAFRRDAILYRRMEPHRKTYQHHFRRIAKEIARAARGVRTGEYESRTSYWLRLDHPKDWVRCPATDQGGCGGVGSVALIGECPKCNGRGYRVYA